MADLAELTSTFGLDECVECRACSDACPSCRNGGVDPQLTILSLMTGGEIKDVWKCLVCHRCSMTCPQDIDVAGMMLALREFSSKEEGVPETLKRTYKAFASDGKVSLPKGRMESVRKELGLSDVVRDQNAVEELNEIMKEVGVPDE